MTTTISQDILATLYFASRTNPAFTDEKPYSLNFVPEVDVPRTNVLYEPIPGIKLRSLRSQKLNFTDNGILIANVDSQMRYEDFADKEMVERIYLREVQDSLIKSLGGIEVYIFHWVVRKRDPAFPFRSEEGSNSEQPAVAAHIDYTTAEITDQLRISFGEKADAMRNRSYKVVNVWKPLVGPLRDWPMAYCDPKTVDKENDLLASDDVFSTHVNEIYQVHYNSKQNWYYLPDQQSSEVVIFNGYDSQHNQDTAVPHCSFCLDSYASEAPRQSIEIRAFVFFK